jgi:hypothetical protein
MPNSNPTYPEVLDILKKDGGITDDEYTKRSANYAVFNSQRKRILTEFKGNG